jgi:hypothetical protein
MTLQIKKNRSWLCYLIWAKFDLQIGGGGDSVGWLWLENLSVRVFPHEGSFLNFQWSKKVLNNANIAESLCALTRTGFFCCLVSKPVFKGSLPFRVSFLPSQWFSHFFVRLSTMWQRLWQFCLCLNPLMNRYRPAYWIGLFSKYSKNTSKSKSIQRPSKWLRRSLCKNK